MQLWLVSDDQTKSFDRPELHLHADWNVRRADNLVVIEKPSPDLVIAFQDRPKQITQQQILQCLAAAPLSRIVLVLGPWCEGDLRTPGRLHGAYVLHFGEAELRLARLVEEFRLGKGVLAGPQTALDVFSRWSIRGKKPGPALRVGVRLGGRLAIGASECIESLGHTPVVLQGTSTVSESLDIVIIDGDTEEVRPPDLSSARVLRLCGFSRPGHGLSLAKNYRVADLESAIERLMAEPSGAATTQESLTSR